MDAGVRFDTPENAKTFTGMMQSQIDAAKGSQAPAQMAGLMKVIEKAVVKQNGTDAVVQLKLTSEDVQQLVAMVEQMTGALGGQMGGAGAKPPM